MRATAHPPGEIVAAVLESALLQGVGIVCYGYM
jgi:hypothetical protein